MQSGKLHPNPNVVTLCLLSQYMFCATENHNLFINAANSVHRQNLPSNSTVLSIATMWFNFPFFITAGLAFDYLPDLSTNIKKRNFMHSISGIIHIPSSQKKYRSLCSSAFSALTLLVGWQEGHTRSGGVLAWLSGARCRLAYGPADATATHCLLLQ